LALAIGVSLPAETVVRYGGFDGGYSLDDGPAGSRPGRLFTIPWSPGKWLAATQVAAPA